MVRYLSWCCIHTLIACLYFHYGQATLNLQGPSDQPEAYFNGSAYLRLTSTISLKAQTAFSFKTCQGGELLSQIHNRNIISLSVNVDGVVFMVNVGNLTFDEFIPGNFVNNRWHTVNLLYRYGNLTLRIDDGEPKLLANDSYRFELLTHPDLYNEGAVLIMGNHFAGCIMEGPSVTFNAAVVQPVNVQFAPCPIPEDSCIVVLRQDMKMPASAAAAAAAAQPVSAAAARKDECANEPCMRRGTCVSTANSYSCVCLPRYTGKNCELDMGSACDKRPAACRNGGTCYDDNAVTTIGGGVGGIRCVCPPGFYGTACEREVLVHPLCAPNPCQYGGTCQVKPGANAATAGYMLETTSTTPAVTLTPFGDTTLDLQPTLPVLTSATAGDLIECLCPPGFTGARCEVNVNECASSPCRHNGICIDGPNNYTCDCSQTGWTGAHCDVNVNECRAKQSPCLNRGVCYDYYGGYICQCPAGYDGPNCELVLTDCGSHPCRNHGTCIARPDGAAHGRLFECVCMQGYTGQLCEIESRHGNGQCDTSLCGPNAECRRDGGIGCVCKPEFGGEFPNCSTLPGCSGHPCMNGGLCTPIGINGFNCTCPAGFTDILCEQRTTACSTSGMNLCRNGGTCVEDEPAQHRCLCPDGLTGAFCEQRLSCANKPCTHARYCSDFTSGYYCSCETGWTGLNCDVNVNDCVLKPCVNGGVCIDRIGGFTCQCSAGFTGVRCQTDINDCASSPCKNGGECRDLINDFHCNCSEAWMGPTCEKPYDACELRVCQNNASCVTTSPNKHDYACNCQPGFDGIHCEVNIDDCVGIQCPAGKVCVDLVEAYECRCPPGFTGDACKLEMDSCEKSPCVSGGTCVLVNGGPDYTCHCPPGFVGPRCEQEVDLCKVGGETVCNHGICVSRNGTLQCYCQPGYTGERCNLDFNECLSQPCQNGATCHNKVNNYECECTAGYEGKDCSVNIDECASQPCLAGSTCIDGINEFTCVCVAGLTGQVCEINIDDCMSSPCLNGAQCIDGLNMYMCNCTDTGYTGEHCEQNIDDCVGQPCQNGAECVDDVKDYRCKCHPGYGGKNCEDDIDECESLPCKFGGTCLQRSNATLYEMAEHEGSESSLPATFWKTFDYEEAAGYECLCVPGVIGINCETNINECESSPCLYGTCVDKIGGYYCECDEGFEGMQCEVDIDECDKYQPCVHGTCHDRRASYHCECEPDYGGKNCSIELTGCMDEPCKNNGTCKPYLNIDSGEHRFNCTCPSGFRGDTCELLTTMSMNGNSIITVNTTREEGYEVQFRFKTTLSDGILAVGRGLTFYILELSKGRLNLHSSLLNRWEGVFVGSALNNSNWQRVFVAINSTHLVLSANEEQTIYPITYEEKQNGSITSFPTTFIGGYPNYLRKLLHSQLFLVGCVEDIVINGEWVLPTNFNMTTIGLQNIEVGCKREPQCEPNPCHSGGRCKDQWRTFTCECERPYLGHICQYNYTAATFGYENITDSLVTVAVTDPAKRAVRSIVDISMFVRTRQLRGQIFYLGSALGTVSLYNESYIAAQLENGELFVRIQFNGTVEAYTVGGVKLYNGYNHLIEVIRNITLVQVRINGTEYFRKTISASGTLDAQVLYLGGQPQLRPVRQVENVNVKPDIISSTGPAAANTQLTTVPFKGIIQDVQVSDGSKVMVVEFFPLKIEETSIPLLPFGVVTFDNSTVLEGVLSDDSCRENPCHHGGACVNTWNDYRCDCTRGFKGKDCKELEFCKLEHCPAGSECKNLEDGFECSANATFDGEAAPLRYRLNSTKVLQVDSVEVTYRTRSWGTVLFAKYHDNYLTIFVYHDEVIFEWNIFGYVDTHRFKKDKFDGQWVTISLKAKDAVLKGGFKDLVIDDTPNFIVSDFDAANFTELFTHGTIYLAGSDNKTFDYSEILENEDYNSTHVTLTEINIDTANTNHMGSGTVLDLSTASDHTYPSYRIDLDKNTDAFKGCLGEVRIGRFLLPYFAHEELYKEASVPEDLYLLLPNQKPKLGCQLCFPKDCFNGGHCLSPQNNYGCECLRGYAADDCSINIDECLQNECQNGAACIDQIGMYECECVTGYEGQFCDKEIDECESSPCHHGGTCIDQLGTFRCECPEDYVGKQCEALRLITCENQPCKEGSTCINLKNEEYPDSNFTCQCAPGMVGRLCDVAFCARHHCLNDGICNVSTSLSAGAIEGVQRPPFCDCARGFDGKFCEHNLDDCVLATGGSPCQNGAGCIDGVNRYDCNCTGTGFTGLLCEMDIDECATLVAPCDTGACENVPGSFKCSGCPAGMCGHYCMLADPCAIAGEMPCSNGDCTPDCGAQPGYKCKCLENWKGRNCTINMLLSANDEESGLNILYVAIPVVAVVLIALGVVLVVLINLARSKRATRGTYSPSAQEFCNPRVELDHVLKPPPEERLI